MSKRTDETLYELPETSILAKPQKNELDALLREAHSLKDAEKRLREIKAKISELIQAGGMAANGTLGARYGKLCAIVRWQDGKRSISRELLVENGVTPGQIEASMSQGNGYWVCELPAMEG